MLVKATPENIALAQSAERKLNADARLRNAKTGLWRCAGVALVALGLGAAVGLACLGYGFGASKKIMAEKYAPPPPVVEHMEVEAPRPAQRQLENGGKTVTDFVIFHVVPFATGEVQSGWRFESAEQERPSHQWCLFDEKSAGQTRRTVDLGSEGRNLDLPDPSVFPGVDLEAAQKTKCVWWTG